MINYLAWIHALMINLHAYAHRWQDNTYMYYVVLCWLRLILNTYRLSQVELIGFLYRQLITSISGYWTHIIQSYQFRHRLHEYRMIADRYFVKRWQSGKVYSVHRWRVNEYIVVRARLPCTRVVWPDDELAVSNRVEPVKSGYLISRINLNNR